MYKVKTSEIVIEFWQIVHVRFDDKSKTFHRSLSMQLLTCDILATELFLFVS